jgi:F-type H+-transporting ATPase subunit a
MFGLNHGHGVGGTATQSIWVTGALATVAFVWFNGTALLRDPIGFLKHLTGGAPMYMWPVMVPVEILGTFVKPFALALRLFANMTGGHIIVATLLSFVVGLGLWKVGIGQGLGLLPLLGTIAVYFLELLVALIQAYIFTFLSALFLAQLVSHHDHDHGHEHGHEEEHKTPLHTEPVAVAPRK